MENNFKMIMVVHAIYASHNAVLSFNGATNFINNSGPSSHGGGAICAFIQYLFGFNGVSSFINNSAGLYGGAISSLYDASMQSATLSTT